MGRGRAVIRKGPWKALDSLAMFWVTQMFAFELFINLYNYSLWTFFVYLLYFIMKMIENKSVNFRD